LKKYTSLRKLFHQVWERSAEIVQEGEGRHAAPKAEVGGCLRMKLKLLFSAGFRREVETLEYGGVEAETQGQALSQGDGPARRSQQERGGELVLGEDRADPGQGGEGVPVLGISSSSEELQTRLPGLRRPAEAGRVPIDRGPIIGVRGGGPSPADLTGADPLEFISRTVTEAREKEQAERQRWVSH
jgi:hypothetical protein